MQISGDVRRPAVAGMFYPGSPASLGAMVDELLAGAAKTLPEPIALISPHAGYAYSGHVAAEAFKQIEGVAYDAIIILGTNHTDPLGSSLAVWERGAFSTPLGQVPIDAELAQALIEAEGHIQAHHGPHLREHSIEVQLPFLQRVQPGRAFVPIVVCDTLLASCQALANALITVLQGRKALIIASSDLSHFWSYEDASRMDRATLNAITSLDVSALDRVAADEAAKQKSADLYSIAPCGIGPVKTVMLYAQAQGAQATLLKYANSGDVPIGDKWRVVGYGAVRFAN
jgi:hypothetical protein